MRELRAIITGGTLLMRRREFAPAEDRVCFPKLWFARVKLTRRIASRSLFDDEKNSRVTISFTSLAADYTLRKAVIPVLKSAYN